MASEVAEKVDALVFRISVGLLAPRKICSLREGLLAPGLLFVSRNHNFPHPLQPLGGGGCRAPAKNPADNTASATEGIFPRRNRLYSWFWTRSSPASRALFVYTQ